jgi:Acetyltransferase (GNAT) domain
VVATRIGFVFGKELYFYYSGYHPDWGKYSIMTTLIAEAIKWAILNWLEIVNLSTGTDVSKTRWSPKKVTYRQAIQFSASLHIQLIHAAYSKIQSLSRNERLDRVLTFSAAAASRELTKYHHKHARACRARSGNLSCVFGWSAG